MSEDTLTTEKAATVWSWSENFFRASRILQLAITIAMFIGGYAWSQRIESITNTTAVEKNTADIKAVREASERAIGELRQQMLPRELYEAYHKTDVERLDNLKQQNDELKALVQQLIARQNLR
jgi:hypothetical protein